MKKKYVRPCVADYDLGKAAFPAIIAAASKVAALAAGFAAGRGVTKMMEVSPIERKLLTLNPIYNA